MCYLIAICIIVYFYIGVGACLFPQKTWVLFQRKYDGSGFSFLVVRSIHSFV